MKKIFLTVALTTIFYPHFVHANEKVALQNEEMVEPESKPESEVSFNLALASDYRYRGITQTRFQPAIQGGVDYINNASGLYAGAWMSNIKWTKDSGGKGNYETDLYIGKRGLISSDIQYDFGLLTYVYPSNGLQVNANTTEVYGQLNYGIAYIKYAHAVTNLFGFANSKNSAYIDLGSNLEIEKGLTLNLHVGRQLVKNNSDYSYDDWKIGLTKAFDLFDFSLAVIGTNANKTMYISPKNGKFTGATKIVGVISKTF